ncbi:GDSL-type esterase/lipase family protein [Stenotrophomonas rhizophila]|uniref:SGNH/GDSL hydrolase family protein n=1 Tax=Stenotrophomonas rhizophila TaxID=216778 RepID=UPI00201D0E7A|nr:SGNH/GDSL hydrolase family protein [Stenotrophomonas rhizophila]UQY88379.1 GDSL-type esterase/lipase family protein [Stenotrophomonas rhizophila]
MSQRFARPLLLALALTASLPALALTPAPVSARPQVPEQVSNVAWAGDMAAFAKADAATPPPRGGIEFIGSSSIRMWDSLAADFPGQDVFNRGFGGSEVRDSTWYADQIVIPYAPCKVFFYAGDNDLNSGRTPTQVRDDVVAFVQRVHRDLPKTTVEVISIKPSPSRAQLLPAVVEANGLIQQALAKLPNTGYTDIYTPMLGEDGQPRAALFREDMLHMKPEGYAIWRKALASKVQCGATVKR